MRKQSSRIYAGTVKTEQLCRRICGRKQSGCICRMQVDRRASAAHSMCSAAENGIISRAFLAFKMYSVKER